jgi:hypothetical protein
MTAQQQVAMSDLMAAGPFGRIKIEVNEKGWYWLYIWTGESVGIFVGPNLPQTLQLMAAKLRERYGNEI